MVSSSNLRLTIYYSLIITFYFLFVNYLFSII
ncbi:hypothetical protein PQD69_gp091 [Carnobacterium phage cd4]|uniref:Uncharacterized protein n=1 Tax=Carnobacterium phage cd4 TaxID=2849246 RepID=A0AAE7VHN7_9CAUD|nr:hypothetical protein PQD69_gp091 [Carnobacterium phage cd4]QXP45419.1 hypothetical protein cd4_091 [Carnobacterium phage cd4]